MGHRTENHRTACWLVTLIIVFGSSRLSLIEDKLSANQTGAEKHQPACHRRDQKAQDHGNKSGWEASGKHRRNFQRHVAQHTAEAVWQRPAR